MVELDDAKARRLLEAWLPLNALTQCPSQAMRLCRANLCILGEVRGSATRITRSDWLEEHSRTSRIQ